MKGLTPIPNNQLAFCVDKFTKQRIPSARMFMVRHLFANGGHLSQLPYLAPAYGQLLGSHEGPRYRGEFGMAFLSLIDENGRPALRSFWPTKGRSSTRR